MMADRADPASREALRGRVADRYTIEDMTDGVLSVFEKSIERRKSRASRGG